MAKTYYIRDLSKGQGRQEREGLGGLSGDQDNSSPTHKRVPQANSFAASPLQASQVAGDNFSPGAEVLALGLT